MFMGGASLVTVGAGAGLPIGMTIPLCSSMDGAAGFVGLTVSAGLAGLAALAGVAMGMAIAPPIGMFMA